MRCWTFSNSLFGFTFFRFEGCDTGFGHELAIHLDKLGYRVFAGCLLPKGRGAKTLQDVCSRRLTIMGLNVTRECDVDESFLFIRANLCGDSEYMTLSEACMMWPIVKINPCLLFRAVGPRQQCRYKSCTGEI